MTLSVTGLNQHYGSSHTLKRISFETGDKTCLAVLGRNGSGKTTALRTILGLWRASAGAIRFEAEDITQRDTPAIANLGIAYVPESMGIFAGLTVRENLLLAARDGDIDQTRLRWIFDLVPAL